MMAGMTTLASNVLNFLLGTIGKVAWIWIIGHYDRLRLYREISFDFVLVFVWMEEKLFGF